MNHKIIEEIKEECFKNDILQDVAKFGCYSDGTLSFYVSKEGVKHEFTIGGDINVEGEMRVIELIELIGITFLQHRVFLIGSEELVGSKTYKEEDNLTLEEIRNKKIAHLN